MYFDLGNKVKQNPTGKMKTHNIRGLCFFTGSGFKKYKNKAVYFFEVCI